VIPTRQRRRFPGGLDLPLDFGHIAIMKTSTSSWPQLAVSVILVFVLGSSCSRQAKQPDPGLNILFQVKLKNQYDVYRLKTEGVYPDSAAVVDGDAVQPIWSPDRSQFVFSNYRNGHFAIAIADADGSNLRYLTADTADNINIASWFPSGDKIVFSSNRLGNLDIFSIKTDGTQLIPLVTDSSNEWHPIVMPNGKRMLFVSDRTGRPRIWGLDFARGARRMILPPDSLSFDIEPCISPDGRVLAYCRVVGGKDSQNFDIALYDLVTKTSTLITTDPAMDRWPRFSRDGSRILFHSNRTGTNALHVYDIRRRTIRPLNTGTINSSYGDW